MAKLYQNIPLKNASWENPKRLNSKFWNEGKFDTFVAPFLPEDCKDMTFVELGCNAGMYLKMSKDKGFRNVIGVEMDSNAVKEGIRYRDSLGYDYKILNEAVGIVDGDFGEFDINDLPVIDVLLMSTFHYYIDIYSWFKLLDQLRTKVCRVIVVSRPDVVKRLWMAQAQLGDVREYFKEWKEVGLIDNVSKTGDTHPRDMFSVAFDNPIIKRVPISDIRREPHNGDNLNAAMLDFAKTVVGNPQCYPLQTTFYEKWKGRKELEWSEEKIINFVLSKHQVIVDVINNGIKEPVMVYKNGKLSDGGHRVATLEALGYKSVIARYV